MDRSGMMIKSNERPKGMSQVDWLWLNYKDFVVGREASEIPSDEVLLTEKAIAAFISKATEGGITSLVFEPDPDKPDMMRLRGLAVSGEELTVVDIPKEEHIVSFEHRQITQTDIDRGAGYKAGTDVLAISTNLEHVYFVDLASLNVRLTGRETDTVLTEVTEGVVSANLKIDGANNSASAVELRKTHDGVYTELKLDDTGNLKLEVSGAGLKASLQDSDGRSLAFRQLTMAEYMLLESPNDNIVYFITDKPFIILNGERYGIDTVQGDYPIVSLTYDETSMRLYYKKGDGTDIQHFDLGPVSAERGGMLSTEQYAQIQALLNAVGEIPDVSAYVAEQLKTVAISLEKGEPEGDTFPLYLKNGNGNILSEITLDKENYLSFAEQKTADAGDVAAAGEQEVEIEEGDAILILTLNTGDKVYVKLSGLVDIYRGESTNTANVTVSGYTVKADVRIPETDHIIFSSVDGVSAKVSLKQEKGKVSLYGKTETPEDKLGEFVLGDQFLSYRVLSHITEQHILDFPPSKVDGMDYDAVTNPVTVGETYLVLTMGLDTGNSMSDFKYHWYISISKYLDEILVSTDPDNVLTKGRDGHLYAPHSWIEVI